MLAAVDDIGLRYSILQMCLDSYVKDGDPDHDPFVSPIMTSDEVRIAVG